MAWSITFEDEFDTEYGQMDERLQNALLSHLVALENFGPQLGRPKADTLNGSQHANMKELRFNLDGGVWRVAYAFDTEREGIVLVAGDKSGTNQKRFYKELIAKADQRFTNHLDKLSN
ncbi:MAG: type II toxin-antitoxin system RelE/ParE family toxin [Granulosicoccus sp.]